MLSARLLATIGAVTVLAGACGGDLSPLPIGLEFRSELPGQCPSSSCEDYGLDCGAIVLIRVFNAGADPFGESPPLLESCVQIDSAENLCSLAGAGLELGELPAERLRLEVAMWVPDDVGQSCPTGPMFDLAGLPLTTFDPQPAFAGSKILDVGDRDLELAEIELTCFNEDPLGDCGGEQSHVVARIDDIDTLLFAPALAATNLAVTIGIPKAEPGMEGETIFVIDAADDFDLELTRTVPVPQFEATVPAAFPTTACLQVLDVAPQSTTAVTCSSIDEVTGELDLVGYLVGKMRLDEVLMLLGEPSFPVTGLVIGRVVDDSGQPSGGATVTATIPTGGSAEVLYIDEGFTSVSTTGPTASHGFFLSAEAPFGSRWTALHVDGREQAFSPITGLIQGKITALVIELDIAISTLQ